MDGMLTTKRLNRALERVWREVGTLTGSTMALMQKGPNA